MLLGQFQQETILTIEATATAAVDFKPYLTHEPLQYQNRLLFSTFDLKVYFKIIYVLSISIQPLNSIFYHGSIGPILTTNERNFLGLHRVCQVLIIESKF